jgi:hypothetical protein
MSAFQEPRCRACGCTDHTPCIDAERGPCGWAEADLCTHCADPRPGTPNAVLIAATALHAFLAPGARRRSSLPTPADLEYGRLFDDLTDALEALGIRTDGEDRPT